MEQRNNSKKTSNQRTRRAQLMGAVVGSVTQEANRKRKLDTEQDNTKRFKEPEEDEGEMRDRYPDDKVLLDICFGGRASLPGIKRSTLLITITTNKTAFALHQRTDLEKMRQDIEDIVMNVVQDKRNWIPKVNTQAWGVLEVEFSRENGNRIIEGLKNRAEVKEKAWEEGSKFKRIHLHVMASLTYQNFNGYFHLNKRVLWDEIRSNIPRVDWGERLPYINIRFIKNAVDTVAEYINKLHNQEEYETLAKRTLDRINEYQQGI